MQPTAIQPRVMLLTHYYAPELGAPQTRLREIVRALVELGHEIRVVTGPPHYPDGHLRDGYTSSRPTRDVIDGVPVLRLPMLPRPNRGLLDRVIDQGSFSAVAMAAMSEARRADVILVESPPLFLGATAAWLRLATGRPYLYHVADPWPDFPVAMGMLGNPVARRLAFALESLAYRRAGVVTTVSPGLVELLDAKPAARGKVRLLVNGVDTRRFDPGADRAAARAELGWPEARLTLAYVGTIGLAQGVGTLVDALAPLGDEGIEVHLVGEGADRDRLAAQTAQRGIRNVHFDAPVTAERVPRLLAAADGLLVMLKAGYLYDRSLPTKLVEAMAAGRPVIASAGGDTAAIVTGRSLGFAATPGDPDALRQAIRALADAADRPAMGARARSAAVEQFDRQLIVRRLSGYLAQVAGGR